MRELSLRKGVKPARSIVGLFTSALLLATLAAPCAWGFPRFGPDNIHNLVVDGFTGAGTCDECHAAGGGANSDIATGDRLLRWGTVGVETDGQLCAANCHNAAINALPADRTEWDNVNAARANPPRLDRHPVVPVDCDTCHNRTLALDLTRHPTLESTSYCNCLGCHTDEAVIEGPDLDLDLGVSMNVGGSDTLMGVAPAGSDFGRATEEFGRDTEVDKFFSETGAVVMAGHLSDHTIVYNTAEDLCSNAFNECLKCHGGTEPALTYDGHPGVGLDDPLLFYPDTVGPVTAGTGIVEPDSDTTFGTPPAPVGANWDAYLQASRQNFCLSCHDGVDNAGVGAARLQIGSQNVPTVPQSIFTMPGQVVTVNTGASFPFYETNGHGIPLGIEELDGGGTPGDFLMNLTCLAGPDPGADNPSLGCHSAHGTANIYNLEDTNFAAGVDTLGEMGSDVCMSANCHATARTDTYPGFLFHSTWTGGGRFLHIDDLRGRQSTATYDPLARQQMMNLDTVVPTQPNLWYFESPTDLLPAATDRVLIGDYSGIPDDVKPNEIGCITCHDPHGTSLEYWNYFDDNWGTQGMVKRFITTFYYDDPLCGNCHVNPNP